MIVTRRPAAKSVTAAFVQALSPGYETQEKRHETRVEMKSMRRARGWPKWAIAWALPLLGACAGLPRDASMPINDPNEENTNCHVMAANQEVMRPASEVVKTAIPGPVHDRLRVFECEREGAAHLR